MENIRFLGKDIGHPAMQGLLEHVPDGLIITAGGADIWGRQDQFYFVSQQYVGNFDFKARLESLSRGDLYSKTGIMARESLQAGSKHVYLLAFPDNSPRNNNNGGFEFQYRSEEDGESKAIYPSNPTAMPPIQNSQCY